jgi:hypothetical protein
LPLPQHCPQSFGQLWQVSPDSHFPLPQVGPVPHPPHVALWHSLTQALSHAVVQQKGSMPQTQDSHEHPLQPGDDFDWQPSQVPQSLEQVPQSSVGEVHFPSPQVTGQGPQSVEQFVQVSGETHFPSPQ